MVDTSALRSVSTGSVLEPGDAGYAEQTGSWQLNIRHSPEVVVTPKTPADVVEAVRFALANQLAVSVQATGHGTDAPVTAGVLINTSGLDTLTIDPVTKTAEIGAGITWGAVIAAAAEHGLGALPGSGASVGVIGFLAGGGLGPLARSHGFSSDRVTSLTVVTGDGELVEVSAETHPDLFWALRGGKYGLGIVVSLTFALIELPDFYGGSLVFDAPDIEAALRAWAAYTASAREDVTTSVMILRAPDLDVVPPPLRGRTLLMLRFAAPVDAATGAELAAPLRGSAPVYLDMLGPMKPGDIGLIHNDPTEPQMSWAFGGTLDSLPDALVTTLLGMVGPGNDTPLVATELRHIGSATAKDVAGGSAVGGRSANYAFNFVGAPNPALFGEVLPGIGASVLQALAPYESKVQNINFAARWDAAHAVAATWPPEIAKRLAAVREQYDPAGVFADR